MSCASAAVQSKYETVDVPIDRDGNWILGSQEVLGAGRCQGSQNSQETIRFPSDLDLIWDQLGYIKSPNLAGDRVSV